MRRIRGGWQKASEWMKDGNNDKERAYIAVALVAVMGFAMILKTFPGPASARDLVMAKFSTAVAAANLHQQLLGAYPSAARMQKLLAGDGVKATVGSCQQALKTPSRSKLLFVDPSSSGKTLYVHGRNTSGLMLTLIAQSNGASQVSYNGCASAAMPAEPPAHRVH